MQPTAAIEGVVAKVLRLPECSETPNSRPSQDRIEERVTHMYRNLVTRLVGIGVLTLAAASTVHAGAVAVSGFGARVVAVGTAAQGGGACVNAGAQFGGTLTRTCVSVGATSAAGARATAGPGRATRTTTLVIGTGIAGPGTLAATDTTVADSFDVSHTANAGDTTVTVTINGRLVVNSAGSATANGQFRVIVYRDSATAVQDSDHDGTGAAFIGILRAASGPNQSPSSSTNASVPANGFVPADFSVTTASGRLDARATNLTKTVRVPSAAVAVVKAYTDDQGMNVPVSSTPFILALALLLGGAGFWMVRRRTAAVLG